jgi:hypothetical protein
MAHNSDQNSGGRRDEKDALTGGGYPAGQKPTRGVPPVPAGLKEPRNLPPQGKHPK